MFLRLPLLGVVLSATSLAQTSETPDALLAYVPEDRAIHAVDPLSLDASGSMAPPGLVLQNLRLTARDSIDASRPDLPQAEELFPGVSAIRLADRGLVLRYRSRGRRVGGVLAVDADGAVRPLLELPFARGHTPLSPFIAVSAWEPVAAVMTAEDRTNRGDVYLLRLDGQSFPATGRPWRRITASHALPDPEAHSLTFARGHLYYVDDDTELLRAPTDGSADATPVPLPPSGGRTPAELSEEMQVSEDGSTVVLLAGEDEKIWDIYVGPAGGSFRNLTQAPAEYQPVGHLTSDPVGPLLALSEDGGEIVYGCECPELELFHRGTEPSATPTLVTGDAHFAESMDDGSGVAITAAGIVMAFGEARNAKDLFNVLIRAGQIVRSSNLTATSGDGNAPFETGGSLLPRAIRRDRGGRFIVVDDRSAELGRSSFDLWSSTEQGASLALSDLHAVPSLSVSPPDSPIAFSLLFEDAAGQGLAVQSRAVAEGPRVVLRAPSNISLRGLSASPTDSAVALIASAGVGIELPVIVEVGADRIRLPQTRPGHVGARTHWTADGRCLWSWGPTPDRIAQIELFPGAFPTALDLGTGSHVFLH